MADCSAMSAHRSSGLGALSMARPEYPYPGLRPFEDKEWSIFFGRERMVDEVIDRLAAHRLVLIHGSSGSGKSSLVRAGVLPKLARQHLIAGAPWLTCSMRPSGGPLWNVAKELARLEGNADVDRIGQIVGQFSRRGVTLSTVATSLQGFEGRHLCILVDQFEELFRFEKETSREEAELFVDLLVRSDVEAADSRSETAEPNQRASAVHVLVTMRSEFLGECARFYGLAEVINRTQYLMPRMDRDGLLRAIRRPAQLYGAEVNLDLAERLISDAAGREDELPLIQHGLMLMWHKAAAEMSPGHKIVLDAAPLEAAGGLAKLLSLHADAVFNAVAPDPERRYAVERLFRALTDVNVEGRAIRRPLAFRDLVAVTETDANTLRAVVDVLRRDGVSFLTPYPPHPIADGTPIDIGHEALIRCWDRISNPLDGWLKRELDDGLVWRLLLVEARSFERNRRRVLSPATTEERWEWWKQRKLNAAWAERYGGNFALVERLIDASRRKAARRKQRLQTLVYILLAAMIVGLFGWINQDLIAERWRWYTVTLPYGLSQVKPYVLTAAQEQSLKSGDSFRECARYCPVMIVVPAGSFMMGSPSDEQGRSDNEGPQHLVTIAKPFAVAKVELTFEDWNGCVEGGGCGRLSDLGWGRGARPVINVNWDDAQQYVSWLSQVTGKKYRLLSESEYEYATRAGTTTAYPWGDVIRLNGQVMANCDGCGSQWDNRQTAPVGSFPPNKFGLYDMVGNVSEWTEDCDHIDYTGAPTDGSAWIAGGDCVTRIVRSGSWNSDPADLRSASRDSVNLGNRFNTLGFRVARTLVAP